MRSLFLMVLLFASISDAQVRFARPYSGTYRLGYGFDNDGGASGCDDYNCGSTCYGGHNGSDFATPLGTTVRAAAAGTVIATNDGCADYGALGNTCGGQCGNYAQIRHADGTTTVYCHMRRGSIAVSSGQSVTCGQVLGQSASSGNSTGPHLHFGFRPAPRAAYTEPFRGSCGRATSMWIEQRGYREAPGASCSDVCTPSAETCNGLDDDCDGAVDEDEVCDVALLHEQPSAYAAPRTTDLDGDGRADLCARGASGVRCWRAIEGGWDAPVSATAWSDEQGWADAAHYATLRMGDLNGDGRADLCARADAGVVCALSLPEAFEGATWQAGLSDDAGWSAPARYTTLRLADVNGDRRDDLCARDAEGFGCWLSDGARFDRRIEGPRWSDASGWDRAPRYGTIRMADLNGDLRADVCARAASGLECWLSDGEGFPTRALGPAWSDDAGFGERAYWSTLRLADVDGDGRADACIRTSEDLRCHRSEGAGFGEAIIVAELSDASGWADVTNYASLRAGDLDGDGAEDLCLRANAGMRCFAWDGAAFRSVAGPAWSDENGWAHPQYYETVRVADFDGDGLEDLCARAAAGWRCHASLGDSFAEATILDELRNDGGWDQPQYYSTILIAGHACRAEMEACNGRDDDCDGQIDEHATVEIVNGVDDDCDGEIDEASEAAGPDAGSAVGPDAGSAADAGDATRLVGSCSCRAAGSSGAGVRRASGYGALWALACV
ncbi:MAG: VCBS repeat domain-containing M23 family metallopeptidase, partial [Sandaracinaceae bacterium]|nr:VCBS repeat domain-containing M23 family metallopeptidase [Sandaracinaceae bacterium]